MRDDRSVAPGQSWIEIITRPTLAEFATAFDASAVLQASVLPDRVVGAGTIRDVFLATRAMYDRIAFSAEAQIGSMTMLEWHGEFQATEVTGITLLDHDANGLITNVRLFHEPFKQVTAFAADLSIRMDLAARL